MKKEGNGDLRVERNRQLWVSSYGEIPGSVGTCFVLQLFCPVVCCYRGLCLGALLWSSRDPLSMSMTLITTKYHVDVPVCEVVWDHIDVPGLCRTGPPLTGYSTLEGWLHLIPAIALGRVNPPPLSDNIEELALVSLVSRPPRTWTCDSWLCYSSTQPLYHLLAPEIVNIGH